MSSFLLKHQQKIGATATMPLYSWRLDLQKLAQFNLNPIAALFRKGEFLDKANY